MGRPTRRTLGILKLEKFVPVLTLVTGAAMIIKCQRVVKPTR